MSGRYGAASRVHLLIATTPCEDAPINTEAGLLMPGDIAAAPGIDPLGGDHHDEVSWQWRHELVGETEDTELQKWVRPRTSSC